MCLDDYDFPLPAVGRDAVEDTKKKWRRMTLTGREKKVSSERALTA